MDIVFNCPQCAQELEVDENASGEEIQCPTCSDSITIPAPDAEGVSKVEATESNTERDGESDSGSEKPQFSVRSDYRKTEVLVREKKKDEDEEEDDGIKRLKIKTIKHSECVEVGRDRFDEIVSSFLNKVGEDDVISVNTIDFTTIDIKNPETAY